MNFGKRVSTKQHWEDFWTEKKNVQDVYDNSERIVRQIKMMAGNLKGLRILEVGAGTGRDSYLLAKEGAVVTVLDYANNSLTIMQELARKNPDQVLLVKGDAFQLPIPDNSYDVVFHQGLLEHFENPQPIVNENYRVLKKNGLLLVDVPQKYHVYTVIKHILIALDRWFAGWETEFSIAELRQLVNNAGFQVVQNYGEWMRPSLFYRIIREVLLKANIKLPLYPQGLPGLRDLRTYWRERFRNHKIALNTGLDIGVVGKKV